MKKERRRGKKGEIGERKGKERDDDEEQRSRKAQNRERKRRDGNGVACLYLWKGEKG